jgi:Transmembrane secretion effector
MARRSRAVERGTAGPGPAASAWAPLRIRLFRTLWIASLVSNVGTWMQTVGAHRERQTGTDLEYHDDAAALSDPPPRTDHYLAAAVPG